MPCPYAVVLDAGGGLSITFADAWDSFGYWTWTELKGWFGSDVRQTLLDPAGVDGVIVGENRKGGKPLVLNGFGGSSDGDGWWKVNNRLEQVTDALIGADGTLTVHEPTGNKQVTVRMSTGGLGLARQGVLSGFGSFHEVASGVLFQIPLLAANPAKIAV